ncbi:TPA: hypothetical protein JG809_004781 [Vibrio parahaemolyticus]|uniref:hypothetical protein n=1 Tax=Vibrio parahaemolyticus TaxID=670 RepID=UPI0002F3F5AA|nr:hypothetical protein [Vibrio parahaemolyticus]EJA7342699.1 hypothetical protein [Vibrio parahaemolyticus]MBY3751522.1 hypothetical protein [Vibrio parahaemolyticus]MBY3762482.1 hypothetical protein [Vibrio parahaemolyticus]MBY3762690.1 hypothetical protein [Vibrio parahaemolyticus]MBY3772481.1 hypothetical protein [Vibrio parahaemolyticus]
MPLSHSFEDLAQTFRVLVEADFRYKQLVTIDRPEAVGNVETAINAMLNAFHNLYDLMQQELGAPVDWYDTPELCVILAIRNARHHNKANRIRSIYNYHVQTAATPNTEHTYYYANFLANPEEEGGSFFDIPISWGDIKELLELPRDESRLRASASDIIRNYVNADLIESSAEEAGVDESDIFINFVPLAMNAGIKLHSYIESHVNPQSVEATSFLDLFGSVAPSITSEPDCDTMSFSLPE